MDATAADWMERSEDDSGTVPTSRDASAVVITRGSVQHQHQQLSSAAVETVECGQLGTVLVLVEPQVCVWVPRSHCPVQVFG